MTLSSLKQAIVIHSGGLDSSLCLHLARKKFGEKQVLSVSFDYQQRLKSELEAAQTIARDWGVEHVLIPLDFYRHITSNALVDTSMSMTFSHDTHPANTLVVCRNGLMATIGAIIADQRRASCIVMGIIDYGPEGPGYRDCSRDYMDLKESLLKQDLGNENFSIWTPLANLKKEDVLELAFQERILNYLLETTITCYEGLRYEGCQQCPSCLSKNTALKLFLKRHPEFKSESANNL